LDSAAHLTSHLTFKIKKAKKKKKKKKKSGGEMSLREMMDGSGTYCY